MLRLSKALHDDIIGHCQGQYPKEACGMLAGAKGDASRSVLAIYAMRNVEDSPISYSMDPKEQLAVEKQMRQRGQVLVGIYHSHTASAASPSSVDVRLAISPDISYVLVSLKERQRPDIKSYRIDGTTVTPEEVRLV